MASHARSRFELKLFSEFRSGPRRSIYVGMVITYSKGKDRPGKVANPARGQLYRKINISLSPFAPENLVSRDGFGSRVPRQPAHLHTQAEPGAYLRNNVQ